MMTKQMKQNIDYDDLVFRAWKEIGQGMAIDEAIAQLGALGITPCARTLECFKEQANRHNSIRPLAT